MRRNGYHSSVVALYLIAVAVQVLTWSDLSSNDRSDRVVLLLLAGAFLAAIVGKPDRK
ncbi:MAG: hypothetical protein QME72_10015 [Rhodococcus sp. (in: high G+C Gram-positive bacteria)]|nr:hypothetical protein [Rhodococcus sp. (in: high G+C Gram-positive bacteria)]MDI6628042.1 hypothetical protein [Rhodococcus sp. (in: high G+C Gram-positive bacteria)]